MNMMLPVDTAVVVPVNIAALLDDGDFKTRETAVAYNAGGMDLVWNFLTPAGVLTQTAVTPTTGGVYDWTHLGDAMYTIEIPASGGGSINNDTEGWGWFSGICNGVLPWRGPTIAFVPQHVIDALVNGTGNGIRANVQAIAANVVNASALATDAAQELAALIETYIVNEGDATAVLQAIADKIAADWIAGDASPLAVAAAVWANGTRTLTANPGLTAQQVRDAMKLAPAVGDPAVGSVDKHLDDIEAAGGGGGPIDGEYEFETDRGTKRVTITSV